MGDHRIRSVLLIERIDEERLVVDAVLDGGRYLVEDSLSRVDKELVQMFLLPRLVQDSVERLDACQLALQADWVTKSEKRFEVAECHRCRD